MTATWNVILIVEAIGQIRILARGLTYGAAEVIRREAAGDPARYLDRAECAIIPTVMGRGNVESSDRTTLVGLA